METSDYPEYDGSNKTKRGTYRVSLDVPWRVDGGADDAEAPVVLCLHGQWMEEDFFALLLQKLHGLPFHFVTLRATYPLKVPNENKIGASWYPYDGDQKRFLEELALTEGFILSGLQTAERSLGLQPRKRALLGFSQGGYCASFLAMRNPDRFHGLVVSGARVKTEALTDEMRAAAQSGMRVLLCHGERDEAVPMSAAEKSARDLTEAGVATELRTFASGHSIGRNQVRSIGEWLMEWAR